MQNPFRTDPSATAAFKALGSDSPQSNAPFRAVVIGGGTGAPVSIRTLLSMGLETSVVVAMADDGGSTGILREEAKVTPPGDIRKCLAAFAANPDDPLTRAFKYRFEFARNHTLGNLMLSALEEATSSFPEAISICEKLLDARGHVYPSTLDPIILLAQTCDGQILRGQAKASASSTALQQVWLDSSLECAPYEEAKKAIREADLIVLGPGSLFTSIIPNLLVPGIVEEIANSKAKTVFVCSLADMQGETWGLSAREHVEALLNHGMRGHLDYVLIHSTDVLKPDDAVSESFQAAVGAGRGSTAEANMSDAALTTRIRPVPVSYADVKAIQEQGPVVLLRDMIDPLSPTWHNPRALRDALIGVLKLCRLPQM